jgi:hypothetical protein
VKVQTAAGQKNQVGTTSEFDVCILVGLDLQAAHLCYLNYL